MSFTNYLETKVLGHVFSGAAYSAPATKYIALYTVAPSETGGGTEVTGGAYARQSMAFTTTGNTASNTAAVEFATATANWGIVSHIGIFDAVTGGNLMVHASLTTTKNVESGDIFRVPTGDLDISLD